ncbi:HEAT repeat domain-containing protein [Paenibacillus wulumuqiensis]|uniref:HEAT repeat domain-containing protein n=1 Tax=Paenibacillus wulumuqiensis TaxID=1567107 RepID=UPI0006194496|nr:HEAT repeat domain-containing protein [Paenibacillus wulumuqiensis]
MNTIDPDSALTIILWLCAVMLAALIALYVYLAIRKASLNRRKAAVYKMRKELEMSDSVLEEYLSTGETSRRLSTNEPFRMEAIQEALLHRLSISRTPEERTRIYDFAERYFSSQYEESLHSRQWSTRMNTLLWIEQFQMTSMEKELLDWMADPHCSEEEYFQILRILSKLNSHRIPEYLLGNDHDLSDSQLLQILLPLNDELQSELIAGFEQYPFRVRCSFIDSLRIRNIRSAEVLDLLERQLSGEDSELRIRALKAISNFGYLTPEATRQLVERMEHEHDQAVEQVSWPERLMRARVMGNIREDIFVPYLEEMLGDSAYRVRQQAAESIAAYKNGLELLEKVAAGEHADRYAREMAEETLERKQYERNLA